MPISSLSNRGNNAAQTVLRVDMEAYFEAAQNLYDAQKNPTGTFPLNIAENRLTWHLMEEKMAQIHQNQVIPDWVACYTSGKGAPTFRQAVATFMAQFLTKCPIDPENLAFSAGATSVVETTALVLADAGDVAVFPAPCYPVYKQDIGNVAGLERYDLITHHSLEHAKSGFLLDISHLETAKLAIENQGKRFKMLALTTPDNPTGRMYTYEQLQTIADWCIQHKVHLIVNEIYGLSLVDTKHPAIQSDYDTSIPFVSFAQIMEQRQSDYLHLWYAFSKDFGISGFRIGFVYSLNQSFIQAYENLNYTRLVSNYAQWVLQEVLADTRFVQRYITENQRLLTASYVTVVEQLSALQIDYIPSRGSLFVWLDLSEFLVENTQAAEDDFWLTLYHATGILLTPGQGFGHTKRGLFRMVYTCFDQAALEVAMQRLSAFIKEKRAASI